MPTTPAPRPPRPSRSLLADRPLAVQIGSAVAALALAATAVGGLALVQMSQQTATQELLYSDNVVPLTHLATMNTQAGEIRAAVLKYDNATPTERTELDKTIDDRLASITAAAPDYRLHAADPTAFEAAVTAITAYRDAAVSDVLPALRRGQNDRAMALIKSELNPLAATMRPASPPRVRPRRPTPTRGRSRHGPMRPPPGRRSSSPSSSAWSSASASPSPWCAASAARCGRSRPA